MMLSADRVQETSSTVGTGAIALAGATMPSMNTFASAFADGSLVGYVVLNQAVQTEWEKGIGTYSANSIARTYVTGGSNGTSPVNFSAGTKLVMSVAPQSKSAQAYDPTQVYAPGDTVQVSGVVWYSMAVSVGSAPSASNANWAAMGGSGETIYGTVNRQNGTAYTFALTDVDATVISGSSDAFVLTIPSNSNIAIPIGSRIAYTQGGVGSITVSGAPGVTVQAPNGNTTGTPWDGGVAEKIDTDEWQLWNGPALGTMATIPDAPSDGNVYGRKNGAWEQTAISGATGLIPNEQTVITYTLLSADAGKFIRCTNSSAIALTIPTNATVALPIGLSIPVFQGGAGVVTISGASGVTLESPNGAATTAQGDFRTLFQRATDVWVIG